MVFSTSQNVRMRQGKRKKREERGDSLRSSQASEVNRLIRLGNKLRIYYNQDNRNNELWEVRAIVDRQIIIYRVWEQSSNRWRYDKVPIQHIEMLSRDDLLTLVGEV